LLKGPEPGTMTGPGPNRPGIEEGALSGDALEEGEGEGTATATAEEGVGKGRNAIGREGSLRKERSSSGAGVGVGVSVTTTEIQGAKRIDTRMMKEFGVNIMLCDDLENVSLNTDVRECDGQGISRSTLSPMARRPASRVGTTVR